MELTEAVVFMVKTRADRRGEDGQEAAREEGKSKLAGEKRRAGWKEVEGHRVGEFIAENGRVGRLQISIARPSPIVRFFPIVVDRQ